MQVNYKSFSRRKLGGQAKKMFLTVAVFLLAWTGANAQVTVTLGSGTNTSSYFPNYYYYDYSYSQTIYPASELIAAGAPGASIITKIRYKATSSVATTNWKDWVIYMANVSQDGFTGTSAYISSSSMTSVFSGTLPSNVTAGQWMELTLTTPFVWNGTDNLLVSVDENTPAYGNDPSWAGYTSTPATSGNNRGIYFYQDGSDIDPASPSAINEGTSNSVAQVQFEMTSATTCSGTPTAGTMPVTFGACLYEGFTINPTGSTVAVGLTYQWQSKPDTSSTWTNIVGMTNPTLNYPAGIFDQNTDFRMYVTCTASSSADTSAAVTVTVNPVTACYCSATNNSSSEYLSDISSTGALTNINYSVSSMPTSGYDDQTSTPFQSFETQTFQLNTTFTDQYDNYGLNVWIDWDQDGDFSASEKIHENGMTTTAPINITIPAGTAIGDYRVRIRALMDYNDDPDPNACGNSSDDGSTVDFKLSIITSPLTCLNPTNLGISTINDTMAVLTWDANSANKWQVEFGPTGFTQGTGTLNLVTNNAIDSVSISPASEYDYYVRSICGAGDTNVWVGPFTFMNFYCTPSTNYTSDYVSKVITTGALTNLNYSVSSQPAGSYDDQTAQTLTAYIGSTFSGSASYVGGYNTIDLWVDWNHDFTFDASERIIDISGTSPQTLNFNIPVGTPTGTYRLRLRGKYSSGSTTPCGIENYGSTIDFTLKVVNVPTCLPVTNLVADSLSNDAAQITWNAGNASQTSWVVEWGTPGFTPGTNTGIDSMTVSDSSYLITNLVSDSTYDVYVKGDCGGGFISYWNTTTFRTDCDIQQALGYCENFETLDDLSCWRVIDADGDGNTWGWSSTAGVNGGGAIVANVWLNSGSNDDWLIMPQMHLTGNEVLSFKYRSDYPGDMEDFEILLSTTDRQTSSFTDTIMPYFQFSNGDYLDTNVNLSAYTGDVFIAFHIPVGGVDDWQVFLDDICINICTPVAGTPGTTTVCRGGGVQDLSSTISSPYSNGSWSIKNYPNAMNGSILDPSILPAGTYQARYVVPGACTNDTTIATVTVEENSSAGVGLTQTVCKNAKVNLLDLLSGNADLGGHWLDYTQQPVTGNTVTAPNLQGSYNYFYITSNGICSPDTATVVITVDPTCDALGVNDAQLDNVNVYPNPTSSQLNISNPANLANLRGELIDINGRLVMSIDKSMGTKTTISIENLQKGIYMLHIYGNEGQRIFKVVKE